MRFFRERAVGHGPGDEALADLGDRFDLFEGDGLGRMAEVEQVAELHRRQFLEPGRVFLVGSKGIGGDRGLQQVHELAVEAVGLAAGAVFVEAPDRERDQSFREGAAVLAQDHALDALQPDAGDARIHAGEEFRDQRARQAKGLEIVAAAIRADDGDAHLGDDLEEPLVHGLLVAAHASLQGELAEEAAGVPVGERFLGEIGVDRGGADTDQDREVMHVHAFAGAHVERGEGA